MSVFLSLTGPDLPEGRTSYLSLCFLFIYLSAYFHPRDQDSDGEGLRNGRQNAARVGLPASAERGRIHTERLAEREQTAGKKAPRV